MTLAINGIPAESGVESVIWGWGRLSQNLIRAIFSGKGGEAIVDRFVESRYQLAVCRRKLALAQSNDADRERVLQMALLDISTTVRAGVETSKSSWVEKLNRLYHVVQVDLGREPISLDQTIALNSAPQNKAATEEPAQPGDPTRQVESAPLDEQPSENNIGLVLVVGATILFIFVLAYLVFSSSRKRNRVAGSSTRGV